MKTSYWFMPQVICLTVVVPVIALSGMATAQETNEASSGKTRQVLEEVVVTAQKRSENLTDVPLSVSVLGGDEIREKGLKNLNEVSLYAPNTRITAGGNGGSVKMRGLGSGNNAGFEQAVGFIIDGIYYGRINYMRSGLVDLGNIEILRGPQGTLMGKNAIAGAINMSTINPHPEWEFDLGYGWGDRDREVITAIANVPVVEDALSIRLVAKTESQEGHYYNETLDRDSQNLDSELYRIKVGFDAIDNLRLVASYEDSSYTIFGGSLEIFKATEGTLRINREYEADFEAEGNYKNWGNDDTPAVNDIKIGSFKADYDWGDYLLTSITGWSELINTSQIDADAGPIPFLTSAGDDDYEQTSQEFRLTSPEGAIDYVAGLFLFTSEFGNDSALGLNSSVAPIVLGSQRNPLLAPPGFSNSPTVSNSVNDFSIGQFQQDTTSAALFGQLRWHVLDRRLTLMAGLRYSYEEKEASMVRRFEGNSTFFTQIQGHEAFETEASRVERDFSPKLSTTFSLNDDVNIYATYAKAFKSGGYNAAAITPDEFEYDEEKADTYELGLKGKWLDGMLRTNIAAFYTEFQGLQVSSFNGDRFVVRNAADATTQGIELDATLLAAAGLIVKLSAGYTDAAYDNFANASCPTGENPPCDLSGRTLDRAPEWTGTLGFNYNIALGDLPVELLIGADATYQGSHFTADDLDPVSLQSSYTKYNARLGLQAVDASWQLLVSGINMSDEKTLISSADVPVQPGSYMGVYHEPKTVSFDLRVRY